MAGSGRARPGLVGHDTARIHQHEIRKGEMTDYIEADRHRVGQVIDGRCFLGYVPVDSARIVICEPMVAAKAGEIALDLWGRDDDSTQIEHRAPTRGGVPRTTAVVAQTEIGDGLYPVFAYVNEDGRPYRVVIELGAEWSCMNYGNRPSVMEAMPPRETDEFPRGAP